MALIRFRIPPPDTHGFRQDGRVETLARHFEIDALNDHSSFKTRH